MFMIPRCEDYTAESLTVSAFCFEWKDPVFFYTETGISVCTRCHVEGEGGGGARFWF